MKVTGIARSHPYCKDAAEWLADWDSGRLVWTLEMGGMGPAYEQVIHIVCAEVIRFLVAAKLDANHWIEDEAFAVDKVVIEEAAFHNPVIIMMGPSSAQWMAALWLACTYYRYSPDEILSNKEKFMNRHIQVSKYFPNPYKE